MKSISAFQTIFISANDNNLRKSAGTKWSSGLPPSPIEYRSKTHLKRVYFSVPLLSLTLSMSPHLHLCSRLLSSSSLVRLQILFAMIVFHFISNKTQSP